MAAPAWLRQVHPVLRKAVTEACGGDFSRLRQEDDGSITVLNHAAKHPPDLKPRARVRPAGQPVKKASVKRAPVKGAVAKAPAEKASAPRAPRRSAPVSSPPAGFGGGGVVAQAVGARAKAVMPRHLSSPEVLPHTARNPVAERALREPDVGPEALQQPVLRGGRAPEVKKSTVRVVRAERAPVVRRAPTLDRVVPPEFDIREAWENLDVEKSASKMLTVCRQGLPAVLPLDLHSDVLALQKLNADLVISSVRNPHFVEIAGKDTKDKGYPILRFYRGDVMTVVGMREAQFPTVIATYATSRLDADEHRAGTSKGVGSRGGGGARKAHGLPGTPNAVMNRLRPSGVDFNFDELHDTVASVMYRGQELGKLKLVGSDRKQCESDYQRILRKVDAIQRREAAKG